jgi:hypothetical protein
MRPNDTGATKSCGYCGRENEYFAVCCHECGTSGFVYSKARASAQTQTKRASGFIWRDTIQRRSKLFVLVGVWVLFFPKFVVSFFGALGILTFGSTGSSSLETLWLTLVDGAVAFVILYQVTRNYGNFEPKYLSEIWRYSTSQCCEDSFVRYSQYH